MVRSNDRRRHRAFAPIPFRLVALLLVATAAQPGRAQSGGETLTYLTAITVVEDTPARTVLKLQLTPRMNTHVSATDASGTPAVAFTLTARGRQLTVPGNFTGPLKAIRVEENPGFLFLRLDPRSPGVQIGSIDNADNSLTVTLSDPGRRATDGAAPPADTAAPGLSASAAGSVPPTADFSAMGFELVMLEYADVSEVAGLLTDSAAIKPNDTFVPRSPGFGSANTNGVSSSYNPGPQTQSNDPEPLGRSINANIGVDRRLNAIWLRGDPATIARLKAQIAAIDQPIDTVMLETQIVELTQTGARNLGLDIANANGQIATATATYGNISSAGSSFPLTTRQLSGGVNLQASLYAQIQKGEGRILSRPRISAQSGSAARIVTGDAIPILTSITLSGVNGVSQQVQYVNVGVTLQIAPRVTEDGIVSSHIYCVVSSVTGYLQGYPTISQREAETYAAVRDGESFVIGGLSQESSMKTRTKLPILGDIPILSILAGASKISKQTTELYIMVTPHVIRRLNLKTVGGREAVPAGALVATLAPVPAPAVP